jgi:hypothetical protein
MHCLVRPLGAFPTLGRLTLALPGAATDLATCYQTGEEQDEQRETWQHTSKLGDVCIS